MKRFRFALALTLAVFLALPAAVSAQQQGAPVYLVPNMSIATAAYVTGTASDSGTVNKQLTVTITPTPGNTVYVVGWDATMCQDATSTVATNVTFTTTGFSALPKIGHASLAATANICANDIRMNFGSWPLRALTNTVVTFVSPAAAANRAYSLNVYALIAP